MHINIKLISFFIFTIFFIGTSFVKAETVVFSNNLYWNMGESGTSEVKLLQQFLLEQKLYSGEITGNYFSRTYKAVVKFQMQNGVTPSGYFGPLTRKKANEIILSKNLDFSVSIASSSTSSLTTLSSNVLIRQTDVSYLQARISSLYEQVWSLQKRMKGSISATSSEKIVTTKILTLATVPTTTPSSPSSVSTPTPIPASVPVPPVTTTTALKKSPVNATVSAWSNWVATSVWSTCLNGSQTRNEERTRTVLSLATNGGTTPTLKESRTVSQACNIIPPTTPAPAPAPIPTPTPAPTPVPAVTSNPITKTVYPIALDHDGLVTNEYAFFGSTDPKSIKSSLWEMTSGSLFVKSGSYWSGIPDLVEPNYVSSNGSGSAIFRLTTKNSTYQDVSVSFNFTLNQLVGAVIDQDTNKPPVWDGAHMFLRYQSETSLYYASFSRRDGEVVLKKKCTGGPDNGGTYYELSAPTKSSLQNGANLIRADIKNISNNVKIDLYINSKLVASAIDSGIGCSVISKAGKVGIRGDNANFNFDNFTVTSI